MATVKSNQELYDLFIAAVQDNAPDLTDTAEGSILDTLAGVFAASGSEINKGLIDQFNKTFFATAHGPEITGSSDDLQTLATDHFGTGFARVAATKASGTVTFSRPSTAAGNILIPAGTVVKTAPNANGATQRFATLLDVTITGTSINASVQALVAGADGNAAISACNQIESSLLDSSITVSNAIAFSGGAAQQDDAAYREFIRNKIEALRGATLAAIEAAALAVTGVVTATGTEADKVVVEYDLTTHAIKAGAAYFRIPDVRLYIADANGTANQTLVNSVQAAIDAVRAAGVRITVQAATALLIDWTATITLNPAGPNYATLSSDPSAIKASMRDYVNALPIGTGFTKASAEAAILAIWGPSGTTDLTAFVSSAPSGNVAATAVQKLVANTMGIS